MKRDAGPRDSDTAAKGHKRPHRESRAKGSREFSAGHILANRWAPRAQDGPPLVGGRDGPPVAGNGQETKLSPKRGTVTPRHREPVSCPSGELFWGRWHLSGSPSWFPDPNCTSAFMSRESSHWQWATAGNGLDWFPETHLWVPQAGKDTLHPNKAETPAQDPCPPSTQVSLKHTRALSGPTSPNPWGWSP